MAQLAIDELLKQCQSIYKLVVIAAKRAKELSEGAPKFVESNLKKITSIALEEIRQGKILYKTEEVKGERLAAPSGARQAGKTKKREAKDLPTARVAQGTKKKS